MEPTQYIFWGKEICLHKVCNKPHDVPIFCLLLVLIWSTIHFAADHCLENLDFWFLWYGATVTTLMSVEW